MTPSYVPLWVKTHFSFLEGASRPDELVERAHALGFKLGLGGVLTYGHAELDETVRAVNSVDLTVHRGEVVGLIGESGAGCRLVDCNPEQWRFIRRLVVCTRRMDQLGGPGLHAN